jgi:hypothetical protein
MHNFLKSLYLSKEHTYVCNYFSFCKSRNNKKVIFLKKAKLQVHWKNNTAILNSKVFCLNFLFAETSHFKKCFEIVLIYSCLHDDTSNASFSQ